jgi:uncharacterized integral membrane protein
MVQQSPGADTSGVAEGQKLSLSSGAIASLTGVGLLVTFMIQNVERVTLHFLFWSFTWPLWLLTLVMVGALVVRTRCDAPSLVPQGAPRRPTALTCLGDQRSARRRARLSLGHRALSLARRSGTC